MKSELVRNEVLEVKETEDGDIYSVREGEFGGDTKEQNVDFWDEIDDIATTAFVDIAKMNGVIIDDLAELTPVKEMVEIAVKAIEERYGVKYKHINSEA